ncbi:MAG TPA: SRPBCC domain-containing protein [Streptosporangiaceae bacterium]|nr:SRPBCC domain-containing protein [Streptosporangiaceae bacterium]
MADYSTSVDIGAPREVVFAHLVTAERMVSWMGQHAQLRPTPGGGFAVDINGVPVRGEYLEVDPPHRVVVSWGMAGSDDLPPGYSRVEFTLTATADGTRLDLVHTGLPDSRAPGHAKGWAHYLARLQASAGGLRTGTDQGPDPWEPGSGPSTPA